MYQSKAKAFLIFSILFGGLGQAADLRSPYSWETTTVLPKGVLSPKYLQLQLSHQDQFSNGGLSEPLGMRITRDIPWKHFLGMQKDAATRAQLQGLLGKLRVSADGNMGQATGTIRASATGRVPQVGIGITDKLSLGVVIPMIDLDLTVEPGFKFTEGGQRLMGALCATSRKECEALERTLANVSNVKLQSLGYLPLRTEKISGLGDIQLAGKYQWVNDETQRFTTKLGVFFPTGTKLNPDRAIDITTGENRYRVGGIAIYDRHIVDSLRANLHVGYTALLENEMTKRLPVSEAEPLSADKAAVTRDYGHRAFTGVGLDYGLPTIGMTLSTAYHYQHQSKQTYRAGGNNQARASLLAKFEPVQELHSFVAGAGFSTVNWYKRGQFFLPFDLNLIYSRPIAGRNVPNGVTVAGELIAYF